MDSTFVLNSNNKMEKKSQYQCTDIVASGHTAVNMSRHSLLMWINETLSIKILKVEELCSGAVYCQLLDILFPGIIPLKKIKLDAKVMNEYWSNFKQLQIAFRAIGCKKDVPINRLIEGRFQDNFEFLQWFKRFYDANIDEKSTITSSTPKQTRQVTRKPSSSKDHKRPVAVVNAVQLMEEEEHLKSQIAKYEERAETVNKEKDFFLNKLRRIEIICNADDAPQTKKRDLIEKLLGVLYSTDEEELAEDNIE